MRRFAYAMPLLAVPLAAAACGGSKSSSNTAVLPDDPAAAVAGAARKTVQAGSEHVTITGRIAAGGEIVTFSGSGDFDTKKKVGSLNGTISAGALNGPIEEVTSGPDAYVKSALLSAFLPGGKTWVRLDLAKVAKAQGVDITSFLSQDPAQALTQLKGLQKLEKVGTATLGGVATTHYRGTIDVSKASGGTATTGTGRSDVWIGEDGYVHRVKAIVTTGGTTSTLTTELSAFGKPVSVEVPKAADTFDGTKVSIPGLGG